MDKAVYIVTQNLRTSLKIHEKRYIQDALTMYDWDKSHTAEILGIGLSTLYRKITEHRIKR